MVYTADSAALAVLEVRVHLDLDWDVLPDDYVLLGVNLPDGAMDSVATLPSEPRQAGDAWLRAKKTALLKVPSMVAPESFNILINPVHANATGIALASTQPFTFDPRLWR